jgi:hypothetical protein
MRDQIAAAIAIAVLAVVLSGASAPAKKKPPSEADRAAAAAVIAARGGKAVKVGRETEGGAAWEVEVLRSDRRRLDVLLDSRFRAIHVSDEREPVEVRSGKTGSTPSARWGKDAHRAAQAASKAMGGGALIDLDRASEKGATWEVEFVKLDGKKVVVLLDDKFRVVRVDRGKKAN